MVALGNGLSFGLSGLMVFCIMNNVRGDVVINYEMDPTDSSMLYAVPEEELQLGVILRGNKSVALTNDGSDDLTVMVSLYYDNMYAASTQEIVLPPYTTAYDVTQQVNDLYLYIEGSMCSNSTWMTLWLKVQDSNFLNELAVRELGYISLMCQEPTALMVHVNCPHGIGKEQGTTTTFEELCGPVRSVTVSSDMQSYSTLYMYLPPTNWQTNNGVPLGNMDFNGGMRNDITWAFDGMVIDIPNGECDNREQTVEFPIMDGIITVSGYLTFTALCSYANLDMKINNLTASTDHPWIVVGGDISGAVAEMDFEVTKEGDIPLLVYTDSDGATQYADFLVAMFLTQRPSRNITMERCGYNKHVADIHGQDIVIGKPVSFKYDTVLSTIKRGMMASLQNEVLDNICGPWTLVVAIDPIKAMTNENSCNNFLTFNLQFECDSNTATSELELIVNPFSDGGEQYVRYTGPQDSKLYVLKHQQWGRTFQLVPQGMNLTLDKNGAGRLAIIQKYLSTQVAEECPGAIVKDLLEEMEDSDEVDRADQVGDVTASDGTMPDLDIPGFHDVVTLLERMKSEGPNFNASDIYKLRTAILTDDLDEISRHVLNGSLSAMKDIATKSYPQRDVCSTAYQLESLAHTDYLYMDYYFVGDLAYMWANLTYFHPLRCSKKILANYVKSLRSDVTNYMGRAPWLKEKLKGVGRQNIDCQKPNPCIRKITSTCTYRDSPNNSEMAADKETICQAYAMMKFFKDQGKAQAFFDLLQISAASTNYVHCPDDNKIKVKPGPVRPVKVFNGQELKIGQLSPDNMKVNWTLAAVAKCDTCSMSGSLRKRK